jgi:hypothetical protein
LRKCEFGTSGPVYANKLEYRISGLRKNRERMRRRREGIAQTEEA